MYDKEIQNFVNIMFKTLEKIEWTHQEYLDNLDACKKIIDNTPTRFLSFHLNDSLKKNYFELAEYIKKTAIERKENLSKEFLKYGFLPYVWLIKELEQEERYEECSIILEIIKAKSEKFGVKLPTKYTKEAIELFFNEFKGSKNNGNIAFANAAYYSDELRKIGGFF